MADYKHPGRNTKRLTRGQALVEYVLIVTLVALAIIVILTATGPAIGNVFSNTVYNLLNQTQTPRDTLNAQEIVNYSTAYASYTPPAIVVPTNTPPGSDPNAEKPPYCSPPNPALPMTIPPDTVLHRAPPGVLFYCSDPNPLDVLIVQSYAQPTHGSVTVNLTTGEFTYDPQGYLGPYASFTYVVSDQRGGTANGLINIGINTSNPPPATFTPTPQPPATPVDVQFPYPFNDRGDVPSNWQSGFPNVLYGPWSIEYFNTPDLSGSPVAVGSVFWKNGVETLNYNWGNNPPVAGVTVPVFSIRYTALNVSIESRAYQIMLSASGEAELKIDNVSILTANNDAHTVDYNAPSPLIQHDVVLTFKHTTGAASLRLDFNKLADKLTKADLSPLTQDCRWGAWSTSYHSEYNAWQDSGSSGNYVADTVCNLRLRGYIPLPGGASKPQLAFWDHWDTSTQDELVVGVRDYTSTDPWTWVTVHPAGARNLNWRRQAFDLTDFAATPGSPGTGVDFRGKSIELAFKVVSDDGNVADGWYIDDITVDENNPKIYTVGFYDDSENAQISPQNWRNECNWQRTVNDKHSGNFAWASNPSTQYSDNDDCSLVLNGIVDLTSYAGSPAQPELSFWSKAALTTATDLVAVEWAPENSDVWTAFTPKGSSDPFVAQATADTTWHEVVVSLNAQRGQRFQLRLRLLADGDYHVAQGWYVDDIVLREHAITTVGVPFLEPFDNLDRWQVGGTWGLTTGADPVHYGAPTALTDSPAGNYPATINTAAELIPSVDLAGTVHPVLSFWTYWNADANLYVDISKDEGVTWETPVWQKITGASFDGITTQLAWQRVKIDLTPYKDAGPTQSGTVRVRFRLVSASGTAMDGWYIDELAVQEDDFAAVKVSNGTYLDNIDDASSADNWLPGGTWQITSGQGKDASQGWVDSPTNYLKPERSELEFKQAIDLSGTTKPTLYFWMKNMLGDVADHLYVDVSKDNGFTWLTSAPLWMEPELTNLGWHRIAVDLTSLKPASASDLPIRLRFRLEATNSGTSADGWSIDNFTLFDRVNLANLPSPFDDNFTDFGNWIVEGDWTDVPNMYSGWSYQPTSFIPISNHYVSGSQTLDTSNWVGDYWHVAPSHTEVWGASGVTWPDGAPAIPPDITLDNSPGEINFDYSTGGNKPFAAGVPQWIEGTTPNTDYYLMRWQRKYQVASAGTYLLRLRFAGGARLYINNVIQTPTTTLGKPYQLASGVNSNPFIVDLTLRSYWYEVSLSGTFTIKIEYFHTDSTSGPGMIEFAVSEKSTVARTSPGTTSTDVYPVKYRTSIILDGLLTIPAGKVGLVGYKERYSFTTNGSGRVYYSMDEGLTWTEVTTVRRAGDPGSTRDWDNTSFYITDGGATFSTATQVMLKFELFSLAATVGDEGWLIDNFSFKASDLIPNTAPTSSNATFLGITSTANLPQNFCVTPVVVDNGGDSWTFTPISPVRGTVWQQGNQLCFNPPDEWTGHTDFLYSVTDSGSLTMPGYGTASVDIAPYFYKAVNVNGPAINILGNPWDAYATSGTSVNTTAGNSATLALDVPQDANTTAMLRRWMAYDGSGTMTVSITGLEDPGVYTVYVWAIESSTTSYTYDIFLDGTDHMRPVNGYSSGSQGHWSKLGPFTVINPGTQLDVYPLSTSAKIAGIEVWRGGTSNQWTSADIGQATGLGFGSTTISGSTSLDVTATGGTTNDIWGTADGFRYAFKAETGDVDVIAQVTWNGAAPNGWSKAGVMIRATDARGSQMAATVLSYSNGIALQLRSTAGASASSAGSASGSSPKWLKISKQGTTLTSYYSNNGTTWTSVGSATIDMGSQFLVGFAVSSHTNGSSASASFDNIQIIQH